jgi:hypothetical protein
MGGDFGSNGSVVWNVFHGPRGNPIGPQLEPTTGQPGGGPGEPGANRVRVTPGQGQLTVRGKDDSVDTPHFVVTLRFASIDAANSEWTEAVKNLRKEGGDVLIPLHVPNRPDPLRSSRDEDLPLEIRIDW